MARLYTNYSGSGTSTPIGTWDYRWFMDYTSTQNTAGNYSDVECKLYINLVHIRPNPMPIIWKITIDGTSWQGTVTTPANMPTTYLLQTKTKRIYHNSDGNKSIYVQGAGQRGDEQSPMRYTTNTLYALPRILRYAQITEYTLTSTGHTTLQVYWRTDVDVDAVQYSVNGGSWIGSGGMHFTIGGLSPGVQYGVRIRIRRTDSQLWTESGTLYATTTDIARITSNVYNVNSVSSLGVTVRNESGGQCDIYIELLNSTRTARIGNPIRHANTIETVFSVQEIQSLASLIPNSNTCNFRINAVNVIDGQDEYLDYKDGTYSVVNANPIFNNFTYVDSNSTTVNLTGDNQKVIKGYSNVTATVSTSNKATAQQGATMSKYRLVIGNKQVDANYSSNADVNLQLNNIDNNVFTVYAIDSRGNSTSKQISPSAFIDYFDRYFSAPLPVAIRTDDIGSETTLSFNGLFFNNTFGNTQNDITLAYQYKKTSDSTYVDGVTPLTLTKDGNNFSFNNIIAGDLGANGFDANYSYNIRLVATDSLGITNYDFILGTGKPNLAISKNGVAINNAYDETIGGDLQIGGKSFLDYTKGIGDIYSSTNSTNPTTLYGGTWVQLKDRFLIGAGGSYSAGSTGGETTHLLTADESGLRSHNHTFAAGTYDTSNGGFIQGQSKAPNYDYSTNSSGGWNAEKAHNNMPPYLAVYMWYRSA